MGNEDTAVAGFKEAIKLLESLTVSSEEVSIEKRVRILHLNLVIAAKQLIN